MWTTSAGTAIYIVVGRDSTLSSAASSFTATITLLSGKLMVQGCTTNSIPISYGIMNLPVSTPNVIFETNTGSQTVGKCQTSLQLHLLYSKGFTKRNILSTWSVASMVPSSLTLLQNLQSGALATFQNTHFLALQESDIESLTGETIAFKA
jgi:hypothetical protein